MTVMRVVATAGHVDHGKSSLVRMLTGIDPDRWAEEQRRGLTLDLGFAHTTLASGVGISFVDVPGHVRFLPNMLAGVGAVSACVFVVAATEVWKPQSEEHLRILELLGVSHGVIALTKVDLVDDDHRWLAAAEVADRVAGTFLSDAQMVEVSSTTGEGLKTLQQALDHLVATSPAAVDRRRPRLWVDRVFAARGSGTVVTGTLTGGGVAVDDRVVVGPARHPARVRGLQTLGASVEHIGPGHRVAMNLAGVEHHLLRRGDAVVRPEQWHHTRVVDAELMVLHSLDHTVSRRGAYVAYLGSAEIPVRLRVLGDESIDPGDRHAVRLHLASEVPLLPGDRFVLRESGRAETVGGGEILDVAPVRRASQATPDRRVDRVIGEHRWIDVEMLERLTGERRTPTAGRWVVDPQAWAEVRAAVTARVDEAGVSGVDVASLDERHRAALEQLVYDGEVEVASDRVRRPGTTDPLAGHPEIEVLRAGGCAPPTPDTLERAQLRELQRRGVLFERDGLWFHADAVDMAAKAAARLLDAAPEGFTMAAFRDVLGITRKHAVPLATELDARGITRRRGEVRIAGPRLP
jgi:selenocysteine-specific elongation factor